MNLRGPKPDQPSADSEQDDASTPAAARLRAAIASSALRGAAHDDLEAAALQLVTELRNANKPPEQMLLQIKNILAEAGLRPSYATLSDPGTTTGIEAAVYRDVIAMSIRLYYDGRKSDGDGNGRKPE